MGLLLTSMRGKTALPVKLHAAPTFYLEDGPQYSWSGRRGEHQSLSKDSLKTNFSVQTERISLVTLIQVTVQAGWLERCYF
jgi:hypothetical protein